MTELAKPGDSGNECSVLLATIFVRARLAKKLSQEHIAIAAGISCGTYKSLEKGITPSGALPNPTLSTLLRVLSALDLHLQISDVWRTGPTQMHDDHPRVVGSFRSGVFAASE